MGVAMRLVAGRDLRLEMAVLGLDDLVVVLAVVLDVAGAAQLLAGHGLHGRHATTVRPLERPVRLSPVGGLLSHARAVARRELGHRVMHARARARADHHDHTGPLARAHEAVLGPRWGVEEVPWLEASLLALDEQGALPRHDEEGLLVGFGVVQQRLSRLQDGHVDPELAERDRRVAVLALEGAPRAPGLRGPPLRVAHVPRT